MKRWNTDRQLRGMSFDVVRIRKGLRTWLSATDKAGGRESMTSDDKRSIRDEVKAALRWMNDLERAVKLKLPDAAAVCAFEVCEVFRKLNLWDADTEQDHDAPWVIRGHSDKRQRTANAKTTNAKRRKLGDRRTYSADERAVIVRYVRDEDRKGTKRTAVYAQLRCKHGVDEKTVRAWMQSNAKK